MQPRNELRNAVSIESHKHPTPDTSSVNLECEPGLVCTNHHRRFSLLHTGCIRLCIFAPVAAPMHLSRPAAPGPRAPCPLRVHRIPYAVPRSSPQCTVSPSHPPLHSICFPRVRKERFALVMRSHRSSSFFSPQLWRLTAASLY